MIIFKKNQDLYFGDWEKKKCFTYNCNIYIFVNYRQQIC